MLDERSYDSRVYGYYLANLELAGATGNKLPRARNSKWSSCAPAGNRLQGDPDMKRFDASGVSLIQPEVIVEGLLERLWWMVLRRRPPTRMVVVNDKDPYLTIHTLEGHLVDRHRVPSEFGEITDLEEIAAAPDGSYYLLTSHSTAAKPKDAYRRLLRIHIEGKYYPDGRPETYSVVLPPDGRSEIELWRHLENTCIDDERTKCLHKGWPEPKRDCCEVNIEGMAVSPDGENLFFGFREPLLCHELKPVNAIFRLSLSQHEEDPSAPLTRAGSVPALHDRSGFLGPQRISGITLDKSNSDDVFYWILTSYESDDERRRNRVVARCDLSEITKGLKPGLGGALWEWRWHEPESNREAVLHSTTTFHKPEGVVVGDLGEKTAEKIIVFDEDDASMKCLGVPYALFARAALPQEALRPPCSPLLPMPPSR
jgi:hypothetical protein